MKFPGYKITCDAHGCTNSEFFERTENHLDGDWWRIDGEDLCDDCAQAKEDARDEMRLKMEREAQGIAELEMVPYASAIRDNLNGEG